MRRARTLTDAGMLLACWLLLGQWTSVTCLEQLFLNLSEGYDVNEWPTMGQNKPTDVEVQMHLNTFGSLNAGHMDFKLDMFLRQRWNDPRLQHKSNTDHFTLMDPEMHKKMWKPDSYFENLKEAHIHQVTMPNMMLRIYQSGDVLYSIRVTLRLACHLELRLYPFDTQTCMVMLSSYANTDDVLQYRWTESMPMSIDEGVEIAQFDLISNKTFVHTSVYETGLLLGNYSGLTASFTLRRQNGYHLLQTYIPTIMIVAISWVNFWLDPNSVPGRVALGVTTLLTLTTLSAGTRQTLPPVSYVKAIDIWVGMCMVMVFGALLEFTLVNFLANKKMINSKLPDRITIPKFLACPQEKEKDGTAGKNKKGTKIELIRVKPVEGDGDDVNSVDFYPKDDRQPTPNNVKVKKQGEGETYMFYALVVDRFCRIFFPSVFLIFNFIYWPFFVYMQRTIDAAIYLRPT